MKSKIIKETKVYLPDYHSCERHVVVLNGVLKDDIVIRFISSNRNDSSYKIEFKNEVRELIYGDQVTYAAMNKMYKKVIRDIEEVLAYCEIEIAKTESNKIADIICKCISKCESRYGMPVKDYDDFGADAVLTIKGEDDGKPKFIVKMLNTGYTFLNEIYEFDVSIKNDSYYDIDLDMVVYRIDAESITLDKLIVILMTEFDNPYLIITPDFEILLDLKMDTEKYNNLTSKYDRSVEQVKELYNIIKKES